MANFKFTTVVSLAGLLLTAGVTLAHAEDAKPPAVKIPPEMMQGELGKRLPDMLKTMTPEEQKAFIEKFQARHKEAHKIIDTMTPEELKRRKELREKIEKMTPEERFNFKEDPTQKKNEHSGQDNKPQKAPEAPPASGSMMPKH